MPEQLHRPRLEIENPPKGRHAPPAPPPPFLSLFRNPACASIHSPFLSLLPGPVCWFLTLFSYGHIAATALPPPTPPSLGLSSMGKFPRSGVEGRGRMERERKGARLRQKAHGRARQRREKGSLNAHPLEKNCLRKVGVWRDPFSWDLNGFSLGLLQSPTHPLPPRERAASASSLRCRIHPIPAQAPVWKARGPAEPSAHSRLGTTRSPTRLRGKSPSVPHTKNNLKAALTLFSPQLPSGSHVAGLTQRQ